MKNSRKKNQGEQSKKHAYNLEQLTSQRKKELEISFQEPFLPEGFTIHEDWVWFQPTNNGEKDPEPIPVCSRLEIIARTRDANNHNHGRLVKLRDPDGIYHEWAMPMKLFASDGREYRAELLDLGLLLSHHKLSRSLLGSYILKSLPQKTLRCVSQTGWSKDLFVLPHQIYGPETKEEVIFQTDYISPTNFGSTGTLEQFQEIAQLALGNELMIFVISLAFAPPLLLPLDMETGGFNIVGSSSIGKTKLLKLASSIWGTPNNVQQWRGTSNGLEGVAQAHNDVLLCLDELGQICAKSLGETLYMLGNGAPKSRGHKNGGLRKQQK